MTKLLEKAFNAINKLKPEEQETYAKIILSELDSENKWKTIFETSQEELSVLANEAVLDYKKNKVSDLDDLMK